MCDQPFDSNALALARFGSFCIASLPSHRRLRCCSGEAEAAADAPARPLAHTTPRQEDANTTRTAHARSEAPPCNPEAVAPACGGTDPGAHRDALAAARSIALKLAAACVVALRLAAARLIAARSTATPCPCVSHPAPTVRPWRS